MKRKLIVLFGFGIITIDIKPQIAVGSIVNIITKPCRALIGANKIGNLFRSIVFKIINPQIAGATTFVALPGTELTVDRGKADFLCIRRQSRETAIYNL